MRMRKKKYLDERLGGCEEYLIPTENENRDFSKADEIECLISTEEIFGNSNPLHLEIGCGKGQFVTELAKRNPDINFLNQILQETERFVNSILKRIFQKTGEKKVFFTLHKTGCLFFSTMTKVFSPS